ncbi:hypothetical protein [Ilumatobacter sp.]|uniref:hypothetical protein n=1 Tax=Ilumatobacter sp. TaxID=1967498 RepID=UPI003B524B36
MASDHTVADDIVFDLVSIQYHSLKAAAVYDRFLQDAHGGEHTDVAEFIETCKQQDEERAQRCHALLRGLTADGIG